MKKITYLALVLACIIVLNTTKANAAIVASSDQSGGYSNSVLDAVVKKWQPPLDGKERTIRILVMIDGEGNLEECSVLSNEKPDAVDKSACNAIRSIGKFATPPYGLPMDVFLSFWVGEVDGVRAPVSSPKTESVSSSTDNKKQSSSNSANLIIPVDSQNKVNKPAQSAAKLNPPASTAKKPVIQDNRGGAVLDEDDFYVKTVMRKISPHVQFPPELPNKELSTSISVHVDSKGNIKDVELSQASGSEELDNAIIKATQKTGKVTPPPDQKSRKLFLTFIIKS